MICNTSILCLFYFSLSLLENQTSGMQCQREKLYFGVDLRQNFMFDSFLNAKRNCILLSKVTAVTEQRQSKITVLVFQL